METRAKSNSIFGNGKMLDVVLVLDAEAPIHALGIGKHLPAPSGVTPVLRRLTEAGLIREVPGSHDFGAKYFEPIDPGDATWVALVQLCKALKERRTLF